MHGKRGACKNYIEMLMLISFPACCLNVFACVPLPISVLLQGKRCSPCWENDQLQNWVGDIIRQTEVLGEIAKE
jgi:hypothetical protein